MSYVTADRSLPRSLDVQISLSRAQTELRTNYTILCLAAENLGLLPNASRVRFYSTIQAVADDYAPGSEAYFAASAFFAQTPHAPTMAIGEVFLDPQPALLASPALTAAQIALIAAITTGSMKVTWADGSANDTVTITGMNFTGVTTIAGIAAVINNAMGSSDIDLVAALKTLPGGSKRLVIVTASTGDDVTISYPVAHSSGVFVGDLLGLTVTGEGTLAQGYTPTGIAGELDNIANAAARSDKYLYGWCLGESLRTLPIQTAASEWALARAAMMTLCTNDPDVYDPNVTDDIMSVTLAAGNRRVHVEYHDIAQRYPDVSILAYMLAVNYRLKDSTVTAKFKVLPGIETVQLTETQWATIQSKGGNAYTAIGNNARTVRDGTTEEIGWYMDTVINLDNFVEDLSVAVFNVFLRNKKIPYTRAGQMLLVDACHDVGYLYVYNGTFADRDILDPTKKSGFTTVPAVQTIPSPIYLASDSDRAGRVGPPIQMIVQEAGAIHSISLAIEVVS
jgi:hypothetical protein